MFACLFIPDFPVAALLRAEPAARERPMAALEGAPPLVTVAAANERARALGVEPGMTRLQAEAALAAAGGGVRMRSAAQEAAAQAALLDCAHAFSPRVEGRADGTVLADIAGLERLFGPPAKIARELARRASEMGLEAQVAVAANVEAALHAARGFAGVTVLPPGKEAERLGGLGVDVLAPPPELLQTLDRWGVRTLRALAALPPVAVAERLGQAGVELQRQARGEAGGRPLVPAEAALEFEEALELEHPLELLEPLAFLLARLLEQLCTRLGARALAAQELVLTLEVTRALQEVSSFKFQVSSQNGPLETGNSKLETRLRLPVPMLDARVFLKLLRLELEAHPPGAPVVKITLRAEPARPRPGQAGLWLPAAPQPERLEVMLARLARVVGAERAEQKDDVRVGSPELRDTHAPEGFRMKRFMSESGHRVAGGSGHRVIGPSGHRKNGETGEVARPHTGKTSEPRLAMRVMRPPVAVRVEVREGAPARLTPAGARGSQEVSGEVVWRSGPWRASGQWWEGAGWAREEWEVAVSSSVSSQFLVSSQFSVLGSQKNSTQQSGLSHRRIALYRLVRDLGSGEWFVEGSYD